MSIVAEMLQPKNQNLRLTKYEYRLVFAKEGRARFISHLDLLRTFQRVFKRAKIPLWYTQGFNPHAYLMFPLALSLGIDSSVELLDIALTEQLPFEQLRDRVNEKMPEGLRIVSAGEPVMKHTEITAAEYIIRLGCTCPADNAKDKFESFLAQDKIEIEKRSKKKGINLVDIKQHITLISVGCEDGVLVMELKLPAGQEFNLNTNVVIDAFDSYAGGIVDTVYTRRTKIIAKNGESFI